jgi:muconate cycloisomerase
MTATVTAIETFIIDVPTIRPHVLSVATMRAQSMTIVRVTSSDGITGVGEGTTIGGLTYGQESPEGIKLAIDTYFAPLIIGMNAERPAAIMAVLSKQIVGNHFAKCAIETALLDAQGLRVGLPVSELIGGRVRDTVPVLWTLASNDTARDITEGEMMMASRRHTIFKLKIGKRDIAADIAHVGAIKRALGEAASIRVDVNMAWTESAALRAHAMLADVGCDLVEQPISRHNRAGLARLRAQSPIAIMADEVLNGPEDAYDLATRGAADVFSVKIAQSGGLFAAKRVEAIARSAGVETYGGTMLEGGIGTIASAHVFATFDSLPFGTELFAPLLLTQEILTEPLAYADGALSLPKGPGLGVKLDTEKLSHFRRGAASKTTSIPLAQPKIQGE